MTAIDARPFFVGLAGGFCAQILKLLSFLLLEKRLHFRRLFETDGAPNMHSAAFAALSIAIGDAAGFQSIHFAVALSFAALVTVDLWNVKHATSRQAEVVDLILEKLRKTPGPATRPLSYTVADVLTGSAVGIAVAFLLPS